MNLSNLIYLGVGGIFSGNSGRDLTNDARNSRLIFKDTLDYQWSQYIGTDTSHPVWLIFTYLGSTIAGLLLFYFAVDLFKKLMTNDFLVSDLLELRKPLIVAVFLANNAALTVTLALGMRELIQGVNFQIIDAYGVYQDASIEYAKANDLLSNEEVRGEVNNANLKCSDLIISDPTNYSKCMEEELAKAQIAVEGAGNKNLATKIGEFITGIKNNTYDLATYTASSAALADERLKLFTSGIAFNLGADIALFYTALYGPIAISTSLLPVGQNSFVAWLSAFYAIGFTQISNTIMISLMADILTNGRGIESFITATLIGKIIPTLSVLFGAGGGMVLYSSLVGLGIGASSGISWTKLIPKKGR